MIQTKLPRVLFASANLEAGNGGIARVGRMSLKALIEVEYPVTALSFSDANDVTVSGHSVRAFKGSKLKFLANHLMMLPQHDIAVYDHIGLAQGRHAIAPIAKRPFCVWIHGNEVWENLQPGHKKILDTAVLVLVNSKYTLARFEALHGSLPQAHVCHLATENAPIEPADIARRADGSPPTVLMLGRLETDQPGKGHQEMIDCWDQVVSRVPGAQLLIVGRGRGVAPLMVRATRSPARSQIHFLGFVSDDEIDQIWQRTDVFAMPSRQEGFGIVYAEAMARGKAVLASTHDAGQEVNVDGKTGFNVSLDDPSHLVEQLTELLLNEALRQNLGLTGQARWKKHFRYDCFKKRFLHAFARLNEPRKIL